MNKNVLYFSVLRAISCMAIVVLHTFWIANAMFAPGANDRVISMAVRNSMLWAVPCFVMVTGALLLNPSRRMTGKKMVGYFKRVAVPLVVCTLLFTIFDNVVGSQQLGVTGVILRWLMAVLTNGSWLHMWYLYLLIGLYLMLPIYRIITAHCSDKELCYLLIVYLIFQSVIPTLNSVIGRSIGFYLPIYTVYPLYIFLGYAIHEGKIELGRAPLWGLFAINTVGIIVVTVIGMLYENTALQSLGSSYATIPVVMQSIAVFGLMKLHFEKAQKAEGVEEAATDKDAQQNASGSAVKEDSVLIRILRVIDQDSFVIYLLHVLVIYVLYRCLAWNPYEMGIAAVFGASVIVFAATWALSHVIGMAKRIVTKLK